MNSVIHVVSGHFILYYVVSLTWGHDMYHPLRVLILIILTYTVVILNPWVGIFLCYNLTTKLHWIGWLVWSHYDWWCQQWYTILTILCKRIRILKRNWSGQRFYFNSQSIWSWVFQAFCSLQLVLAWCLSLDRSPSLLATWPEYLNIWL